MTKRDNKVMGFSNIKKIGMGTVCLILTVSFTGEMHVNAASLKTAGVSSAIELNASGLRANQLLAKATLNRDDREAKQKEKSSADSDLVMANIRSSLSIRVSPDINAEKTGILYKDNGGRILERKNGWTKLQSGNVVGWAKDTNLLFGDSARKLADEVGVDVVTVQTDALRVREAADENAKTLGLLVRGDQYDILKTGYVQASFVESTFRIDAGETVAEINQREEEEKKAIEQAKKEKAALAEKIQEEARAKDAALAKAKKARELATAAEKKAQEKKAQEAKRQEAEAASEAASVESAASGAASVDGGATEGTKEAAQAQDESAAADVQALQAAAAAAEAEAKAAESAAQTAQSEESEDVKLLASLIYCEAGNQPHEGKVAVGSVVMNRLNSPAYPNTLAGVIYASGQFTPARSGKVDRIYRGGNIQADSIAAAKEALAGSAPVGGATHFRRKGNRQGTIIGAHVFY